MRAAAFENVTQLMEDHKIALEAFAKKEAPKFNRNKQGDFLKKFLIITGGSSGIDMLQQKLFKKIIIQLSIFLDLK